MIPLEGLAQQYGYIGLFLATMISSTIIPFSVESLLLLAVGFGMGTPQAIAVVTAASTIGGFTTYLIGFSGGKILGKKLKSEKMERYRGVVNKGGAPMIFAAAFTPIPFELFSLPAGLLGMNPCYFLISSAAGRAFRFALIGIFGQQILNIAKSGNWILVTVLTALGIGIIVFSSYISWRMIDSMKNEKDDRDSSIY